MRWAPGSAMNKSPALSTATPHGQAREALFAGPPSPAGQLWPLQGAFPVPATVVMAPSGETMRIRPLPLSAMYTFPERSTFTSDGLLSSAAAAGPPSPEKQQLKSPFPTTVSMIPSVVTFRMRALPLSAMYTFPWPSSATPWR